MGKKLPQDLNTLKELWYKKLAASGFKDIEDSEQRLIDHTKVRMIDEEKEIYWRRCKWFLWDHKFKSRVWFRVWKLHCDGLGRREIAKRIEYKDPLTGKLKQITQSQVRLLLESMHQDLLLYRPNRD